MEVGWYHAVNDGQGESHTIASKAKSTGNGYTWTLKPQNYCLPALRFCGIDEVQPFACFELSLSSPRFTFAPCPSPHIRKLEVAQQVNVHPKSQRVAFVTTLEVVLDPRFVGGNINPTIWPATPPYSEISTTY